MLSAESRRRIPEVRDLVTYHSQSVPDLRSKIRAFQGNPAIRLPPRYALDPVPGAESARTFGKTYAKSNQLRSLVQAIVPPELIGRSRNPTNLQFNPAKPLFNGVAGWPDLVSCEAARPSYSLAPYCIAAEADGFTQPLPAQGRREPSALNSITTAR
jgi:hypothetical protein